MSWILGAMELSWIVLTKTGVYNRNFEFRLSWVFGYSNVCFGNQSSFSSIWKWLNCESQGDNRVCFTLSSYSKIFWEFGPYLFTSQLAMQCFSVWLIGLICLRLVFLGILLQLGHTSLEILYCTCPRVNTQILISYASFALNSPIETLTCENVIIDSLILVL